MKLTIKRNEFLRRLSFTAQAVPSRSAEAQYRNYLIEVKEDGVSVIASDGDRSCKASSSRKDEKGNDIKCACMYAYVLGINGRVKLGRSWDEFLEDIKNKLDYKNFLMTISLVSSLDISIIVTVALLFDNYLLVV